VIDLYTYRTANGRKASIMLEECGLPYRVHVVDITRGEQRKPEFRRINPNMRIPAITDAEGPKGSGAGGDRPCRVFETGAILLYLAEKTGRFLGDSAAARLEAIQWMMFQIGGVGPMFGQDFHFQHQVPDDAPPEAIAYGRERYGEEVHRLCGVLDYRLREYPFLAGSYTIADIANFPWVALHGWLGIELDEFVGLKRWYDLLKKRPAVMRGMDVPPRSSMSGSLLEGEEPADA
jgi:GST-like protein